MTSVEIRHVSDRHLQPENVHRKPVQGKEIQKQEVMKRFYFTLASRRIVDSSHFRKLRGLAEVEVKKDSSLY